jgi:glycosyltransferase involved in cell wall biosynthesis
LRLIIRAEKIYIVHINSTSFKNVFKNIEIQEIVKKLGVKSIIHIHGGYFDRFYKGLSNVWRKRLERGLNRSDALICLSAGWKKFFASTFKEAKVYVLENAIDLEPFLEIGEYREYSNKDEIHAIYLGRISKMKGIFDLVEVSKKLRAANANVRFIIAGRSERGELSKLRWILRDERIADRFDLVGEVTGLRRDELFRKADCFILPSHAEGMPITILEAFALGLPVVATRVGAVPEVIEHDKNGLLVEPGDVDGIAGALSRLAASSELRKRLGKAGLEDAKRRFSAERWVEELRMIYTEVAGEG